MAARGRDHHNYKHGQRAGYTEYRYGTNRPGKHKPILSYDKRASVVCSVAATMGDFRETVFENEGAIIAGLRSSFCLQGYSFPRSQTEAEGIVSAALDHLGAVRPTEAQGQREYAESREICVWCKGPLSATDIQDRKRFCSDRCAFTCQEHNAFAFRAAQTHSRLWARYQVAIETSAERSCENCTELFQSRDPNARFCSHPCFLRYQTKRPHLKRCQWCGGGFKAGNTYAKFCSKSCTTQESQVRRGVWVPKNLSPPVFDYMLRTQGVRVTDALFAEAA